MAQIYISLGTNINRDFYLAQGLHALNKRFGQLSLSSLFESEAVGFSGSPFYNMVIGVITSFSVEQVAKILRDIEFAHGREQQAKKFSPRTLDLDLLLYDDLVLTIPAQIPRDEITKNAFVLWPLAEIAPQLQHPLLTQNYQQLWQNFDQSSQSLRKLPLNWQPK
ncbi:MAG: 2-amino-4-hydroxy-6-hydroxymethyldihydropteridine diphosphokinase [Gammaproteobacteria bacterium]|nr:MAG: 2-amino-4-hydroxy-6-hydroxymethyldihydropteridine diphosphokinase [Gammaproteobacteria bacterium]